ncbi:MAG: hydroxymethylbilane synthase [Thermodesulfobacteriota bacterium]
MTNLTIATRGSQLALAQANLVARQLEEGEPGLKVELLVIKTTGDKILDAPLAAVGGKGLFVKEIEDALLDGRADLAVHSMKDVPSELPPGLTLAAVTAREDVRDVLVSRHGLGLEWVSQGGRVGTSSLRRQAQLLALRPDLEMIPLRGNVETRLRKLHEQNLDAVVLAAAGINRLGLRDVALHPLDPTLVIPAVGQGALGLECRADDARVLELAGRLNHIDTQVCVAAERGFLARLEGGCQVPIAGHAVVDNAVVVFRGLVASLDGGQVIRGEGISGPFEAAGMGARVAEEILERGGRDILAKVYGERPA